MTDLNDKNAVYNLLRLVREQREAIHELRLLLGAVTWMVTKGDEEKMRELNATLWQIDQARPSEEAARQDQWESWLLSKQIEIERDRVEVAS